MTASEYPADVLWYIATQLTSYSITMSLGSPSLVPRPSKCVYWGSGNETRDHQDITAACNITKIHFDITMTSPVYCNTYDIIWYHNINHLLLVDHVSLWLMEDEETVPAIWREHLQGTVPQEVSPLVDLSYRAIWPLDTANECVCMYACVGAGDGRQNVYM